MDKTIDYAYRELNKYYNLVTGKTSCDIKLILQQNDNNIFDDSYTIDVTSGQGTIVGINCRSILLGVYHLFRMIGVRFIRPGKNGEKLVNIEEKDFNVKLNFIPSYRHRGITIEGSNSLENILDLIEYAPKAGFNSYFIQFRSGYEFFERWYKHKLNSVLKPEEFSPADADKFMKIIISELQLRQLIYHAVGHGWTSECFGIPSTGWHKHTEAIPSEIKENLAMTDGERKYYKNIPLNTHLCYSKSNVRQILVDEVVSYLKEHKEIDVLHFWLADDCNNICECDGCKDTKVADFYIKILNEIDRQLTELKINTKICFLVYLELYWTAAKEKIANEDRFIMMFAPIFRTYTKPYFEDGKVPKREECTVIPYDINKVKYPSDAKTYLAFLYEWQDQFKGDSFDFDYHLMWDIYRDLSGITLSKVLYSDIVALKDMGLNGLVSCQLQRAFYPNALSMYVMGQTLINRERSYEDIEAEFFDGAYGEYSSLARDFFYQISELVSFKYFRGEVPENDEVSLNNFAQAIKYLPSFISELMKIGEISCPSVRESIKQLNIIANYLLELLPIVLKKANGFSREEVIKDYEQVKLKNDGYEKELSSVVDGFYFNLIIGGFIEEHFEVKLYAN